MMRSSSAGWWRTSWPRTPALEVVGTAANGRIALARMAQVNPDLVILDVEMPEMDGLATLAELRKTYPRLPVIMFSALTERGAEATLDALALGATDYFTKPTERGRAGGFAGGHPRATDPEDQGSVCPCPRTDAPTGRSSSGGNAASVCRLAGVAASRDTIRLGRKW